MESYTLQQYTPHSMTDSLIQYIWTGKYALWILFLSEYHIDAKIRQTYACLSLRINSTFQILYNYPKRGPDQEHVWYLFVHLRFKKEKKGIFYIFKFRNKIEIEASIDWWENIWLSRRYVVITIMLCTTSKSILIFSFFFAIKRNSNLLAKETKSH